MTHLADRYGNNLIDELFPPGAKEIPVKQGQILGYQGDYSGNPDRPVGGCICICRLLKTMARGGFISMSWSFQILWIHRPILECISMRNRAKRPATLYSGYWCRLRAGV